MPRGQQQNGMASGPMNTIIDRSMWDNTDYPVFLSGTGFIGLLVIVAVVILGPVSKISPIVKRTIYRCRIVFCGMAGSIQAAVPNQSATSAWNSSYNTNLPTGAAIWTTKEYKSKTKRRLRSVLKTGLLFGACHDRERMHPRFLHCLVYIVGIWNWSEIKGFTNSMLAYRLHKSDCVKSLFVTLPRDKAMNEYQYPL